MTPTADDVTDDVVVWPPEGRMADEAEAVLNELQRDAHAQQQQRREIYEINYRLLSLLIAIAMPIVPEDFADFLGALYSLERALPRCVATDVLEQLLPSRDQPGFASTVSGIYRLFREARWHNIGRPCLRVDDRLAASLMLTDVPSEILAEVRPPWPSFLIRLPPGLFGTYSFLAVHHFSRLAERMPSLSTVPSEMKDIVDRVKGYFQRTSGFQWGLYFLDEQGVSHWQNEATLDQHMGREEREYLVAPNEDPPEETVRMMELAARLVAGVCLMASEHGVRKQSTKKKGGSRWRLSRIPETIQYTLGGDVRVSFDCREAVSAYLSGESRRRPSYQWVVRGHFRNQACGPRHSQRRRQWIEPYWKGPEDAPRLGREHVFTEAPTTDDA